MKSHIATRTISKIILAGLIVSCLPMNLTAKTRRSRSSLSLASWKTQRPSKEAIDKAVKDITKLTKRLRRTNFVVTSLIAGAGVLGISAGAGLAIIGIFLLLVLPVFIPLAPTFAATFGLTGGLVAAGAAPYIITGIITAIVSGHLAVSLLIPITGGLTAAGIITPLALAKKLKKIEKKYPGILTGEQAKAIGKLNKVIRGPINKGIVKGMRLKTALKESVNLALQKHTGLSKQTIQNYITRSRTVRNLKSRVDAYKAKIQRKQTERDKHSKLSFAWHKNNLKVIKLKTNLKYIFFKARLKKFKNKVKGIHRDSLLTQKLAPAVSDYIDKADKITADLAKELAKAVAAAKKGKK